MLPLIVDLRECPREITATLEEILIQLVLIGNNAVSELVPDFALIDLFCSHRDHERKCVLNRDVWLIDQSHREIVFESAVVISIQIRVHCEKPRKTGEHWRTLRHIEFR